MVLPVYAILIRVPSKFMVALTGCEDGMGD